MLGLVRNGVRRPLVQLMLSRNMAYYNIEWKPAPYPCTKAEREAAAKRYGILASDYQTFPNDGLAPGDYPNLEPYNEGLRDPWEHYDYYPLKRNYMEPAPFCWDLYTEVGYDQHQRETQFRGQSTGLILFKFLAPFFVLTGIVYLGEQYKIFKPMKAKQFPFEGQEHYTFEVPE